MAGLDNNNEQRPMLDGTAANRPSYKSFARDEEANSIIKSHVTKEEQEMSASAIGERLPYNDYTTIDWLHDLVVQTRVRNREA